MPLAYSYVRFSTPRQADGDSLRRQSEMRDRWLREHSELGLELVEDYRDMGVSAMKGANRVFGALGRFEAKVDDGSIPKGSYLLVESLDRLSRDEIKKAVHLVLGIVLKGIVIVSIVDGVVFDPKDDDSKTMMNIMLSLMVLARATNESAMKSERGLATWTNKRKDAANGKPLTTHAPAWIKWDAKAGKFMLIDQHAATVRRIFEMAGQGLGTALIIQNLIAEGRPNLTASRRKDGGKWSRRYVSLILQSRAVLGEYETGRKNHGTNNQRVLTGQVIENYFPPVVGADLWANAQAQIMGRKVLAPSRNRRGDFSNLFAGLCRCVACGTAMTIVHKTVAGGSSYLRCPARYLEKTCKDGRSYRYQALENAVLDSLGRILLDPVEAPSDQQTILDRIADLKRKIESINAAISRLVAAFGEADEDARPQIDQLKKDRAAYRDQLSGLENERIRKAKAMPVMDDLARLEALRATIAGDDIEQRTMARAELASALRAILTLIGFYPDGSVVLEVANGHRFIRLRNTLGRDARFEHDWTISIDTMTGLPRFGAETRVIDGEKIAVGVVFENQPEVFEELFSNAMDTITRLDGLGTGGGASSKEARRLVDRRVERRVEASAA